VAAFYADENFPLRVVEALRRLGHEALTALEAGQANQRIPDHAGIVVCTEDSDVDRLAAAIDAAVRSTTLLQGTLIRITRPA
jgi:hypothetical protein